MVYRESFCGLEMVLVPMEGLGKRRLKRLRACVGRVRGRAWFTAGVGPSAGSARAAPGPRGRAYCWSQMMRWKRYLEK